MINTEVLCQYAADLSDYAESGQICNVHDLSEIFEKHTDQKLYRGMLFPKEWLKIGQIVEEWGDSTHWTTKKEIAQKFYNSMDADDFIEDFGSERGLCTLQDSLQLFQKNNVLFGRCG